MNKRTLLKHGDISHNFVRSPQHYLDYDYLLDYENILKPEYFDVKTI